MADNINVTPGSGATIAAESVGGALIQRVKMVLGDLDSDAGDVANDNAMPVSAASLPLPDGAAKESGGNLDSITSDLDTVVTNTNKLTSSPSTSTKQSDGSQKTQIVDGSGNVIGSFDNALNINITSGNPTSMAVTNTGVFAVQSTDSVVAQTLLTVKVAYTASQTGAVVLTPTSGKKYVIVDWMISSSSSGTVYLFDNTDSATTAVTPTLYLNANSGVAKTLHAPFVCSATNNVLYYTSGAGAAGSIWISYYQQ